MQSTNIVPCAKAVQGKSQTKQEKTLSLPANQPIALTKLSLNISPDDRVKIVVTVSDGQSLHFITTMAALFRKSLNLLKISSIR
ncbi:hypothetical protein ACP0HM_02200 [Escherichia coli]